MKNRVIDLQLVKPISGKTNMKGKIAIKDLIKETLEDINVSYNDPCCDEPFIASNPPDSGLSEVFVEDSSSVSLDGNGTETDPIVAEVNISAEPGNALIEEADGLYVGNVDPSADPASKYLLSEVDDVFTFNGPKMRDISNKNLISLYKMPTGNLTNNYDVMVKNDAMTTATISLDTAGHDNVIVAGSTNASYIQFPFTLTHNRCLYKLRFRADAIGATAPIVGFRNIWPGGTYSNFNNPQFSGHFNLATGVVTVTTSGTTTLDTYNGISTLPIPNGSIIDIELHFEYMRPRIFKLYVNQTLAGEVSLVRQIKNVAADGDWSPITHPAIIMADGEYTILDYEVLSMDHQPLIVVDGDSMSTGVRISHADTVTGKFEAKIPYRIASTGAGSKRLKGHIAGMWQLTKLKPTYVAFFHYIESCQGLANPANGGHAVWSADFQKYVSFLKAHGIIPIFVYPETWAVIDPSGTNCAHYETYLNTNYPSDLKIKVLTSESFYDSTGFHYNGVTNGIIADKLIVLLDSIL